MIPQRPVYLTPEGYAKLREAYTYLTTVRRQEVARRLHAALEEGELIENGELEEARREQAFVEGKIAELEEQLRHAKIIEAPRGEGDTIALGSRVTVREEGAEDVETYYIVGFAEADPRAGKISNESPLGKALLGKRAGEKAIVHAPAGDIVFHILDVA